MSNSLKERNNFNLQKLLSFATSCLRKLFLDRWKTVSKSDWKDQILTKELLENSMIMEIRKNLSKSQRIVLDAGSSKAWDISLLSKILPIILKKTDKRIKFIKDITGVRNQISHRPNPSLDIAD